MVIQYISQPQTLLMGPGVIWLQLVFLIECTFCDFVHTSIPLEPTADVVCEGVSRHAKLQVADLLKLAGIEHQESLLKASSSPTGLFPLKYYKPISLTEWRENVYRYIYIYSQYAKGSEFKPDLKPNKRQHTFFLAGESPCTDMTITGIQFFLFLVLYKNDFFLSLL